MSRLISDVLQAKEPDFSHFINDWELLAGSPGVDVRLSSELVTVSKNAIKTLGLDVNDTTNEELYFALIKKASQDNQLLEAHLSISQDDSPTIMASKVIKFSIGLAKSRSVWVVKPSVCKKILKENPPKKLLKGLGYRSIDSVLKRESPALILALGASTDQAFKKRLITQYKKLTPADFDLRKIEVIPLSSEKLKKLQKAGYQIEDQIIPAYEAGALVIILPNSRRPGDSLLLLAVILEGLRSALMHSAYFKALSTRPRFGNKIGQAANAGLATSSKNMVSTGWPSLHELVNKKPNNFPEVLQPHVQPEDMTLPNIGLLSNEIPELLFWEQNRHVLRPDSLGMVSHNLLDVMINDLNQLPYKDAVSWYARDQLWDTLFSRYLAHEPINRMVIKLD